MKENKKSPTWTDFSGEMIPVSIAFCNNMILDVSSGATRAPRNASTKSQAAITVLASEFGFDNDFCIKGSMVMRLIFWLVAIFCKISTISCGLVPGLKKDVHILVSV